MALNGRMTVKDEVSKILKLVVLTQFKVLPQHFLDGLRTT